MTEKEKAWKTLSTEQVLEIGPFLKDILNVTKDGPKAADRTVEYKDGWSDQKVAEKYSVQASHITGLRVRAFGKIDRVKAAARGGRIGGKKPGFRNPLVLSWERIKASEERIKALEERVLALEDALTSADEASAASIKTGSYSYTNGS